MNKSPAIVTSLGSNPRIDIILPKGHSWFVRGAYVQALKHFNVLGREFMVSQNQPDMELHSYLRNPKCDAIFLMNTDWHAQYLHKTEAAQKFWQDLKPLKIMFSFESMNNPVIKHNTQWWNDTFGAVTRAMRCVDGLVYAHEIDEELFSTFDMPMIWQPFAIDEEIFPAPMGYAKRMKKAFFRGKATPFYQDETYSSRRNLMLALKSNSVIDVFEGYDFDNYNEKNLDTLEKNKRFIAEMNKYQVTLVFPSLSPTMVVRPFEGMASGCVVFQNKIEGKSSQELFKDGKHLVMYEEREPEVLVKKINNILDDPEKGREIARNGYEEVLLKHTVKHRVAGIMDWIDKIYTNCTGDRG